jgi:hypothetical protein
VCESVCARLASCRPVLSAVPPTQVLEDITSSAPKAHAGWLYARSADGARQGYVPQNYTEPVASPPAPAPAVPEHERVFGVPLREV